MSQSLSRVCPFVNPRCVSVFCGRTCGWNLPFFVVLMLQVVYDVRGSVLVRHSVMTLLVETLITNLKWIMADICRSSFSKVHISWLMLRLWSWRKRDIASCDSPLFLLPREASSTVRIKAPCSRLLNSDARSARNNTQCLGSHKLPFQIKTKLNKT